MTLALEHESDPFLAWLEALRVRHGRSLTFAEIRRGVSALSRVYVQERERLDKGAALDGAGKRCAFACFYTPLHFLVVREIVRALDAAEPPPARIVDFGCGLAPAGAAWALEAGGAPRLLGIDRSPWAVAAARESLRDLGLRGRVVRRGVASLPEAGTGDAFVAAYSLDELDGDERATAMERLLEAASVGRVLVVEPIARGVSPWWEDWARAFREISGRVDEWRFAIPLPSPLAQLDRAARLDHRELTARSLYAGP